MTGAWLQQMILRASNCSLKTRAGGFSAARWNYVLMDHEIMNRMQRQGPSVYHEELWCLHSDRRRDRRDVRWNLLDRLLYRYLPAALGDWFYCSSSVAC